LRDDRLMSRPARVGDHRWFGDKRSQVVHDLDNTTDACAIDELVRAETFLVFAPDTLPEARNRCYHPCRHCAAESDEDAA
jgi:hypothetical protein